MTKKYLATQESLNTVETSLNNVTNRVSDLENSSPSEIDLDWDYEMSSPTTYTAPVDIVYQHHICLDKFPNLIPPAGATKFTVRYYVEFEIEIPTSAQQALRNFEVTFASQARVDALTKDVSYDYASGGGATLEPTIYCIDHDKYNNVFRGAFIAYHNDSVAGDAMQTEIVYMEKGFSPNDKPLVYTNRKDIFPDDIGGYPNNNDMSTALAPMFYLANEGSTITQGETIAVIKKLRWKGMLYGDDTFNKLPRISEYDSYIINRNVYNNNRVPFVNTQGKLQTSDTTNVELGYLSGATGNIQTQLDAAAVVKSDAGAYNSDTASDTWNEICKVGNVSIEARYPTTDVSPVRIVNSSGSTIVFLWSSIEGTTTDSGMQAVSDGSSFLISNATANNAVKSNRSDVYTMAGVNTEAYSVNVSIRRLAAGIRIAGSIIGKF